MPTEFNDPIVIDRFKGLFTLWDSSNIPDFYLADSLNVSVSDLSVSPFKMYSVFGNTLSDSGRILTMRTLRKANGIEALVRVRDDGSNTHLEWYNSTAEEWETLLGSLTVDRPMAFADFNTSTQDGCYLCNGVENYSFWTKAIATVASNTSTKITLNETPSTRGFASGGGTVIVDGTEYSYTGYDDGNKELTGLSSLPTFSSNEGVAEAVDDSTYSSNPKLAAMTVADGRVWGAKKDGIRLYYSEVADGSNFTAASNPDDPGFRDFVEGEGSITSVASLKEKVIVFKRDLVKMYKLDYPSSTTRVSISKRLRRGDSIGAVNHQGTVNIGEAIYYVTPHGGIKSVALSSSGETEAWQFDDVTSAIRPTLDDGVFDDATSIYWEKKQRFLVSFKKDSDSTYNDRCLVIEFTKNEELETFKALGMLDWVVGDWAIYNGDLYFGGSYEPNTFKAFDGYRKGSGNSPFTASFTTKRYTFSKNPLLPKEVEYMAVTGYCLSAKINFQLEYDFQGSMAHLESTFDPIEETDYIIQPQTNLIGAFSLGEEPIGGTTEDVSDLNYFKIFFRLPHTYKPRDIQLAVYSTEAGSRWKISNISFLTKDAEQVIPKNLKKSFL